MAKLMKKKFLSQSKCALISEIEKPDDLSGVDSKNEDIMKDPVSNIQQVQASKVSTANKLADLFTDSNDHDTEFQNRYSKLHPEILKLLFPTKPLKLLYERGCSRGSRFRGC